VDAKTDFAITIDRAAGLCLDATCAVRAAGSGPLPQPHRRLVSVAIVALEKAQQALFQAANDPWSAPQPPTPRQLTLTL